MLCLREWRLSGDRGRFRNRRAGSNKYGSKHSPSHKDRYMQSAAVRRSEEEFCGTVERNCMWWWSINTVRSLSTRLALCGLAQIQHPSYASSTIDSPSIGRGQRTRGGTVVTTAWSVGQGKTGNPSTAEKEGRAEVGPNGGREFRRRQLPTSDTALQQQLRRRWSA